MNVRTLGSMARRILDREQAYTLLGATSRGVFVRAGEDWVLYLTADRERGPLTLNVDGALSGLRAEFGDPVSLRDGRLWFARSGVWISLQGAEAWSAPPCAAELHAPGEIGARLDAVAPLLRARIETQTAESLREVAHSLREVAHSLRAGQVVAVTALCRVFLGRGSGLTPEGDDVVLGLLLALNRARRLFPAALPVAAINAALVAAAREKTTALSASLIDCAAQGEADERLVRGLDGLLGGPLNAEFIASEFNRWGSTSGANVFWGIQAALSATAALSL